MAPLICLSVFQWHKLNISLVYYIILQRCFIENYCNSLHPLVILNLEKYEDEKEVNEDYKYFVKNLLSRELSKKCLKAEGAAKYVLVVALICLRFV